MQRAMDGMNASTRSARLRAGWVSLAIGVCVFAGKFAAYLLTGSSAIFSDAMESVVNVVAGALLVLSLAIASRPADRDHPYGHGKVEFFSAGIEGTFIGVAALLILVQAIHELVRGPELQRLDLGLALVGGFSLVNAALGVYLVRTGRRTHSMALEADGVHVLTDVWTSAAVFLGLAAVWITDWLVLDPLVAILAAANILREGYKLARNAVQGLMDQADEDLLARIVRILEKRREPEWIDIHGLRAWRSGASVHVDFHMSVPRYLDVERLHAIHDRVETALLDADRLPFGDVVIHFDPCEPADCPDCGMPDCPVREAGCVGRAPLSVERATRSDEAILEEHREA
jgi:cation diffusion facilitator family transporter